MKNNLKNIIIGILITITILLIILISFMLLNNKTNNLESKNNSTSIKIDNNKDYVYDADYKYNNKYYKYGENKDGNKIVVDDKVTNKEIKSTAESQIADFDVYENVQYLKDLKVPFININSDDAKKVNKSLEKLYITTAKSFDLNATYDENGPLSRFVLNYKFYINNDILSVAIVDGGQATYIWLFNYYTYNFDLKTGKLLTYKDIYTKVGIKENEIENKVEQVIINKQKEIMKDDDYFETNFETFKNESITNYKNSIYNNTLQYYLDENNKLSIITTFSVPAGSGEYDYNIKIN